MVARNLKIQPLILMKEWERKMIEEEIVLVRLKKKR
jgi:hypothetical protein